MRSLHTDHLHSLAHQPLQTNIFMRFAPTIRVQQKRRDIIYHDVSIPLLALFVHPPTRLFPFFLLLGVCNSFAAFRVDICPYRTVVCMSHIHLASLLTSGRTNVPLLYRRNPLRLPIRMNSTPSVPYRRAAAKRSLRSVYRSSGISSTTMSTCFYFVSDHHCSVISL